MAFGFLKKIAAILFGTAKRSQKQQSGKGRRQGKGRGGKNGGERYQGDRQQRGQQQKQQKPGSRPQKSGQGSQRQPFDGRDANGRGKQANRGRGNNGRRARGPFSVNTAAGEMRPGGEISAQELAARKAAHAAWDPATFTVEPVEGKRRFHDFDLPSEVLHGIADLGFKYCTEIQALSLDQALAGKNIAGKAQTGSGKTAAFLVAILTRYLRSPENRATEGGNPRALVIAPTRELVIQICKDADAIGKYTGLKSLAVYGGMDYDRQRREVVSSPVDLLVATPGRLLDFVKSRVINLMNVDTLVIDEADRMLDMGFIPDVRRIMSYLPPKDKRATMLYSATLNDTVMRLAMNWMEEPFKAEVESETNATDTVKQVVYVVQAKDKFTVLFNHIALHPEARTIVFCNRKTTTEDVYDSLKTRGVSVEMLSGDVNQNKRLKVLDAFRDNEVKVVVATDVAGRGIDIKGLEYVVNFDFPYEAEDYVHRIGRTGRAGQTGIAISFADEFESCQIPDIEAYINETLKCTVIGPDDPLMKALPARNTRLGDVDVEAKAEVDAREAAGEDQKAAAAALVGANATTGTGAPARIRTDAPERELPKFENAFEQKAQPADETDVYIKPVDQKEEVEEWSCGSLKEETRNDG
ncbi:MAG: DEAD/DEAH box helicase [Kiritimatiellae bacterium]|nr:DEAD/DEAH box helicase [Kiritimatiellia bacterium]